MSEHDSSAGLKAMGFEAGTAVFASDPSFEVQDLVHATYMTRYSDRTTIPVQVTRYDTPEVALNHVRVLFAEDGPINAPAEEFKTHQETPDWCFEGEILDRRSHLNGQAVRGYIVSDDNGNPCRVYAQLTPYAPDPNGKILYQDCDDRLEEV